MSNINLSGEATEFLLYSYSCFQNSSTPSVPGACPAESFVIFKFGISSFRHIIKEVVFKAVFCFEPCYRSADIFFKLIDVPIHCIKLKTCIAE